MRKCIIIMMRLMSGWGGICRSLVVEKYKQNIEDEA